MASSSSDSSNQTQQGGAHETAREVPRTAREETPSEQKLFQGLWLNDDLVSRLPSLQEKFRGKSDHVLLTSYPKSGTTWLKALLFSIMNRSIYNFHVVDDGNPLVSGNPHESVPIIEFSAPGHLDDPNPDLRLLSTHLPYSLLPKSMIESGCKIVHVMREPKDVLVSLWHFSNKLRKAKGVPLQTFDDAFDMFCNGFSAYGSYWDYEAEFWNASMKCPDTIFNMTYEDMMERPVHYVKKLANFVGRPFTAAEEEQGVVEGIVSFCSFDNLSNLEVNKSKTSKVGLHTVDNEVYFRKAQVGDWKNYVSEEKREHIDQISYSKFKGRDERLQALPAERSMNEENNNLSCCEYSHIYDLERKEYHSIQRKNMSANKNTSYAKTFYSFWSESKQ